MVLEVKRRIVFGGHFPDSRLSSFAEQLQFEERWNQYFLQKLSYFLEQQNLN